MEMSDKLDRAAELLAAVRTAVARLDEIPQALAPQTLAEAYALQERTFERLGGAVAGWKVGATAKAVQELLGVSEPFAAPVREGEIWSSGTTVASGTTTHRQIECEFVFTMDRDFAPRSEPYERAEVVAAIRAIAPAIELIGPRFTKVMPLPPFSVIADCGMNAGLIVGAHASAIDPASLPAHEVVLRVDGAAVARGTGEKVLGDPVNSLVWLIDHARRQNKTVAAGQPISTGTMTGLTALEPGQEAVADFGSLGTVAVTFAAE